MKCKNKAARISCAVVFAAAFALACPAYAFASEGGIDAILPKMNEFIPMLVAFIILWIVLAKFGWPLFDGMLVKRETTIREALEKSEQKNAAIAELQASVADIACAAMTRVVQEDFTDADHRRLIEKSLEEIGTLNA